jgi:hypothetical protein
MQNKCTNNFMKKQHHKHLKQAVLMSAPNIAVS